MTVSSRVTVRCQCDFRYHEIPHLRCSRQQSFEARSHVEALGLSIQAGWRHLEVSGRSHCPAHAEMRSWARSTDTTSLGPSVTTGGE